MVIGLGNLNAPIPSVFQVSSSMRFSLAPLSMKPSSYPTIIIRHLTALMGSMMGRSDERSRSDYDGLMRSLMESVIDGKHSRSSHQGLMRSLMEISD